MNSAKKNIDIKKVRIEINDLRKSLLNFRFQKSSGQLEKTSEIKKTRKKIAKLKTEINLQSRGSNA
jgi:ribosomal protein L29